MNEWWQMQLLRADGDDTDEIMHKNIACNCAVQLRLWLVHGNPCACLILTRASITYSAADLLRKRSRSATMQAEIIHYGHQVY